jgi:Tat protein translocase TatB subunit
MFGIGPWEIVVIVIVALIFIRPSDLPALLRKVGRFFAELRGLRDDVTKSLSELERDLESSPPVEAESTRASAEPAAVERPEGGEQSPERGGPLRG